MDSDRAALTAFGHALPEGDFQYISDDLRTPEVIGRLLAQRADARWLQLVAAAGDAIVGYAALQRQAGWSGDIGEIRLAVSAGWRRSSLGSALVAAILDAAHELDMAQVVVEMLEEQVAGRLFFERLGFSIEGVLEGQVCDQHGRSQNLLVMARHS
jgi:N-acetylglutamate synthase-like GNAT family acetyltransferase